MKKGNRHILNALAVLVFGIALHVSGNAQVTLKNAILYKHQQKLFYEALQLCDSLLSFERSQQDPHAYQLKGYVCHSLMQEDTSGNRKLYRDKSEAAILRSIELDTADLYLITNKRIINGLAVSYFNESANLMNEANRVLDIDLLHRATAAYDQYKKLNDIVSPGYDYTKVDINFTTVKAQIYSMLYNKDGKSNKTYFKKAVEAYDYIVHLDSNDYQANFNLGILYFNEGVDRITNMDPGADLMEIYETQEKNIHSFKTALPYMHKANELKPKREETLFGLSGIYFYLNEFDKSEQYGTLLEEVEGKE